MTGGRREYNEFLDSTELLVPGSGSWRMAAGLLPHDMQNMMLATVGNILYLTGSIEILL